jgi:hypothetical protein
MQDMKTPLLYVAFIIQHHHSTPEKARSIDSGSFPEAKRCMATYTYGK